MAQIYMTFLLELFIYPWPETPKSEGGSGLVFEHMLPNRAGVLLNQATLFQMVTIS